MGICCIYKITNSINNKVYIGQTWNTIENRFAQHLLEKRKRHLRCAFDKYGRSNFRIKLIMIAHTQEIADYWESYFIKLYDSIYNGYNLTTGGKNGKHTDESKKKISISMKDNKNATGTIRLGMIGHSTSEETKKKISLANRILNDNQIEEIKNDNRRLSIIAKEYGVSHRTIGRIKNNKLYNPVS